MKQPQRWLTEQRTGFAAMVTAVLAAFLIEPDWAWAVAFVLVLTIAVWLAVEVRAARKEG